MFSGNIFITHIFIIKNKYCFEIFINHNAAVKSIFERINDFITFKKMETSNHYSNEAARKALRVGNKLKTYHYAKVCN